MAKTAEAGVHQFSYSFISSASISASVMEMFTSGIRNFSMYFWTAFGPPTYLYRISVAILSLCEML